MFREVILDCETTGLNAADGDRVVEIGCVEIVDGFPTGKTFHRYLNPERNMPADAFQVHGLSAEFLKDKPRFADVCVELLAFLGDAPIVAHNAAFDLGFINAELVRCKKTTFDHNRVVDTLSLARRKYPGASNTLEALCKRFSINLSKRTKHGALLDAELLAEVYIELTGKRQGALSLLDAPAAANGEIVIARVRPQALAPCITGAERSAHRAFVKTLGGKGTQPIWNEYLAEAA
jgi:DNA polymerase-3 subunit epsilon